jgi:hypothetical protein
MCLLCVHPNLLHFLSSGTTVAKICNYPKQSEAIHTIEGKHPWVVTIAGKPNQTSQDNNRSFPEHVGQGRALSAATATPSLSPCKKQA